MIAIWPYVASVAASLLFGAFCLFALIRAKKHRNGKGQVVGTKISLAFIQGAALYTMVIGVIGQFAAKIPLSQTIDAAVGNERMCWIFIAISCDLTARMYQMYDPD